MKRIIWGILISLCLISCGKKRGKVEIVYEDGIKVVKNQLLEFTEFDLEPELVIGEGESDDQFFSDLSDVKEDKSGNIYVCDAAENHIKVYDENGKFLRLIGRQGEGPGEFNSPVCTGFLSDGTLIVADQGNQRFQLFSSEGDFIDSHKLESSAPGQFIVTKDDEIYNKPRMIFIVDDSDIPLFYKYDRSFNQIGAIGKVEDQGDTFKTHLMASGHLAQKSDNILLAFNMINKIHLYEDGTLTERIERKLNYVPAKPEIKTVQDGDNISIQAIIDPVCIDIDVDSRGNIYLLSPYKSSYEESDEQDDWDVSEKFDILLEVFTSEGEIIKSMPLRGIHSSNLYIGKGDKLYLLDSYNMQVLRYPKII